MRLILKQPLSQSVGRGFESQKQCWDFSSLKNRAISALMYIYIPANFEVRIKRTPLTRVGLRMSHCTCAVGAGKHASQVRHILNLSGLRVMQMRVCVSKIVLGYIAIHIIMLTYV